jgi:hypothetical protein
LDEKPSNKSRIMENEDPDCSTTSQDVISPLGTEPACELLIGETQPAYCITSALGLDDLAADDRSGSHESYFKQALDEYSYGENGQEDQFFTEFVMLLETLESIKVVLFRPEYTINSRTLNGSETSKGAICDVTGIDDSEGTWPAPNDDTFVEITENCDPFSRPDDDIELIALTKINDINEYIERLESSTVPSTRYSQATL